MMMMIFDGLARAGRGLGLLPGCDVEAAVVENEEQEKVVGRKEGERVGSWLEKKEGFI